MPNVLSFGNIAKQFPIQYLQESDTFQVQLSDHINNFGHEHVDNLYILVLRILSITQPCGLQIALLLLSHLWLNLY